MDCLMQIFSKVSQAYTDLESNVLKFRHVLRDFNPMSVRTTC